jgi:hypothetical protein
MRGYEDWRLLRPRTSCGCARVVLCSKPHIISRRQHQLQRHRHHSFRDTHLQFTFSIAILFHMIAPLLRSLLLLQQLGNTPATRSEWIISSAAAAAAAAAALHVSCAG